MTGAVTGAVSAGIGGIAGELGINDFAGRVAISAIAGGTASVLSGGKFVNGAVTGAFATMFNDLEHGDDTAGTNGKVGTQSGNTYATCEDQPFYCSGQANPSYVLEHGAMLAAGGWAGMAARGAVEANVGSKLQFLFGKSTGENAARSIAMENELLGIGLRDSPATREYVMDILSSALRNPFSIRTTQASGRVVRESLVMGPKGGVKMESIWEGNKLITVKVFSGRR